MRSNSKTKCRVKQKKKIEINMKEEREGDFAKLSVYPILLRYILVNSELVCDFRVSIFGVAFDVASDTGTCNSIDVASPLLIVVWWMLVFSSAVFIAEIFCDASLFLTNNLAMLSKSRPFVSGTTITTKTAANAQNTEYIQNVPAVVIS